MDKHGARLGSLVGTVAGLVFVLVNAGGLSGSLILRGLAIVAVAVAVVVAVVRPRVQTPGPSPSARGC